jgi:hypothetical protein
VVVPAALAHRLGETAALSRRDGVKAVIAAWRAPERLAASAQWPDPLIALIDVPVFGETALLVARRGGNGRPAPIAAGPVTAPRGAPGALHVAEISRSEAGTLAIRGALVPRFCLASDIDPVAKPVFAVGPDGFADTGYPCTVNAASRTLVITGPPAGIVGVGGYRFAQDALAALIAEAEPAGRITALPDALVGQRLAGTAPDLARLRAELAQRGVNPLIIGAYSPDVAPFAPPH